MSRRCATVAGAATVALAIDFGAGMASDTDSQRVTPVAGETPSTVDVGFSQDMIVHHEQAILMAQLVRARTEDPRVAAIAAGIESDQLLDVGTMRGYLVLWSAPVLPAGPAMTWMAATPAHERQNNPMPGMATTAELDDLRTATGRQLGVRFLRRMLRHHAGGIAMMTDAAQRASLPAVRALASRMAFHQREESATMTSLLEGRPGRDAPTGPTHGRH